MEVDNGENIDGKWYVGRWFTCEKKVQHNHQMDWNIASLLIVKDKRKKETQTQTQTNS